MGRYEIVAPLGEGGMGEVYRARDSRLGRSVAIKVLHSALEDHADLRARFRREAEAIAALKHPHICVLHDIGENENLEFLVMEYLEGETLAQRLRRGPLPFQEALGYAIEIASALAAAHRHGFIHRDLKPGNVMLTASGAKILDFGLAKPMTEEKATDVTAIPTRTAPLTIKGAILGTLGYMAPEQLEGHAADARSDLFAMGAILYEMATGAKAFPGSTQAAVIAATLGGPPPSDTLAQRELPALFEKIVMRCVAKSPEQRWESAADLVVALHWIADGSIGGPAPSAKSAEPSVDPRVGRYRWAAIAAGALATIAIALLMARGRERPPAASASAGPLRLSIVPPSGTVFTPRDISGHAQFALSPDGSRIAFVAGPRNERPQLWVRSLASGAVTPLPGTEDASGPFWSPGGDSIAFLARGKLKKVSLDGTPARDVAETAFEVNSGSWSRDGVILFTGGAGQELRRVSESGGPVEKATTLDAGRQEISHRWPQFLPDGRHFLMFVGSEVKDSNGIYISELDSNERTQLLHSGANALYSDPGYLLFEQNGYIAFQRFDLERGTLTGAPVVLPDRVLVNYRAAFVALSAASNGTLAYWYGLPARTELVWLDRAGGEVGSVQNDGHGLGFALSRDGRRVAVTRRDGADDDVWRIELESGLASRVTFNKDARFPIWSPNGEALAYTVGMTGPGTPRLNRKAASGAGEDQEIGGPAGLWAVFAEDWSRDGRWLLYTATSASGWGIGTIDLTTGKSSPLVDPPANQVLPALSPGDEWLAYSSDESGVWEVYVQPFPEGHGRWQVSTGGGSRPVWRGDGKELFYIDAKGSLIAVAIEPSQTFATGAAKPLFATDLPPMLAPFRSTYAASPDGQRFLVERMLPAATESTISVIVDWPAAVDE